jgi:hypothetical protein
MKWVSSNQIDRLWHLKRKISAHNRFHHNCCDKKAPSFDDIRAQSQLNATKYRLSKYANYQNLNNSSTAVVAYDANNYQSEKFIFGQVW